MQDGANDDWLFEGEATPIGEGRQDSDELAFAGRMMSSNDKGKRLKEKGYGLFLYSKDIECGFTCQATHFWHLLVCSSGSGRHCQAPPGRRDTGVFRPDMEAKGMISRLTLLFIYFLYIFIIYARPSWNQFCFHLFLTLHVVRLLVLL